MDTIYKDVNYIPEENDINMVSDDTSAAQTISLVPLSNFKPDIDHKTYCYYDNQVTRYRNNKSKLDNCVINCEISDELKHHLNRPFEPVDGILETPYLQDLKIPYHETKKYLDHANSHEFDKNVVTVHNDKVHLYFIEGNSDNILSSTGFVHAFFPGFDKEKVAKGIISRSTYHKSKHRKSYKYYNCKNVTDIINRWTEWANLGTALHDNIENFINNEPFDILPENEHCFTQFKTFYEDKLFWTWKHFRTEWAVYDLETRIAGKIDYIGIDPVTGHLIIIDWKRVRDISSCCFNRFQKKDPVKGFAVCESFDSCKIVTYSLQLNIYKWILERNYGVYVKYMYLLQMHPSIKSKTPVLYKVADMQSTVTEMAKCRLNVLQEYLQ
jgi:hypothetical protein